MHISNGDFISAGHRTKEVEYRASSLWELDLAWATTVHKAQGGECPVVVLMLSNAHKPLLTRRLLYTGQPPCALVCLLPVYMLSCHGMPALF